jgi:hypothetical protein
MVEWASSGGADSAATEHVRALLVSAPAGSDRLYAIGRWSRRLVPGWLRDPRWVAVVGWGIVLAAAVSLFFHTVGSRLGSVFERDVTARVDAGDTHIATLILVVSAVLTLLLALPAVLAVHRTDAVWPLRLLREAALVFTLFSAMAHFATEGFAALINLAIGLLAMAILSYHLHLRERKGTPIGPDGKAAVTAPVAG